MLSLPPQKGPGGSRLAQRHWAPLWLAEAKHRTPCHARAAAFPLRAGTAGSAPTRAGAAAGSAAPPQANPTSPAAHPAGPATQPAPGGAPGSGSSLAPGPAAHAAESTSKANAKPRGGEERGLFWLLLPAAFPILPYKIKIQRLFFSFFFKLKKKGGARKQNPQTG